MSEPDPAPGRPELEPADVAPAPVPPPRRSSPLVRPRRRLPPLQLRPPGVLAAVLWLAGAGIWLWVVRPHDGMAVLGWFVLIAVVGTFIPGVANQVTLARAYLAGIAFTYVLTPAGLGGLATTVAVGALSDLTDGYIARRREEVSRFGGALDPVVDGVFFGAAGAGLAVGGAYPPWLAAIIVVRYLLPAAAGALLLLLGYHPALRHSPLGQLSTASIAVLLAAIALVRGLGLGAPWIVTVAEIAIPVTALGAWANLAWTNWHVLRREASAGPPR
ncbi:MAG: CDP-alcohol phosphatidyltransferase family protein [Candidatus Dormiibacterota bacterium]